MQNIYFVHVLSNMVATMHLELILNIKEKAFEADLFTSLLVRSDCCILEGM